MKKLFKYLFILIIIFLATKLIIYITNNNKETNYKIDKFKIKEIYNKDDNYYFEITYKKNKFSFISDYNYHKRSKVIEDVLYLENKNILCIYPVLKKQTSSEIICKKDNNYYGYYSVKDENDIKKFIKKIKKKYSFNDYNDSNKYNEYNNMKIYSNNLNNNYKYIIWNYNGIDIIDNKNNTINLSKRDIYNNELGVLLDKYYVTPSYEDEFDFNKIIEINLDNLKQKEYNLSEEISFDSYINGTKNKNIYLMDKDNLKQYIYNIKSHSLEEIGNKKDGAIVYRNDVEEKVNIYDLRKNNIYFENNISLDKLKEKYDIKDIYQYLNRYYFTTNNNEVYLVYKNNINNPIFLFRVNDIKEVKIVNDNIFFISEDNLYSYNRYDGLKKIISKNEFKYNYKNIYDIYQKEK